MRKTIQALQEGATTVQDILQARSLSQSGCHGVWHRFALLCAARVLDQEAGLGRPPHKDLRDALETKRAWLAALGADEALRTPQAAALLAAGRFGKTGYAFLQRVWRRITTPAILQQIRTSSRLIAVGNRADAMTRSFAAIAVVTALAPHPIEAAGQTAAAAIHYAVFADETKVSPFSLGRPGGLQLAPPTPSPTPTLPIHDLEAQLQRPVAEEQAWQSETLLSLLMTQKRALRTLLPLLHARQQRLETGTDLWQEQLEEALFADE